MQVFIGVLTTKHATFLVFLDALMNGSEVPTQHLHAHKSPVAFGAQKLCLFRKVGCFVSLQARVLFELPAAYVAREYLSFLLITPLWWYTPPATLVFLQEMLVDEYPTATVACR